MKLVFAHSVLAPMETTTIFLAGPTPRHRDVKSWRPDAWAYLESEDITVYVPEPYDGVWRDNYDDQVDWELTAISSATVVLFWVPRDLDVLPGFTTNVEFGWVLGTRKPAVYGRPPGAPKTRYLDRLWAQTGHSAPKEHLYETVQEALLMASIDWGR